MQEHPTRQARYHRAAHPPGLDSFAGQLMLRVAIGVENRADLLTAFAAVGAQMPTYFPDEPTLGAAEVEQLVDDVIAEHNELVDSPSPHALALLESLETLGQHGVVVSFATATTLEEAYGDLPAAAERLTGLGGTPRGFCVALASDTADMVLSARLRLRYGVFAETGMTPSDAGVAVTGTLTGCGLDVVSHDRTAQQVLVEPLVHEVPFTGFAPPEHF